jgi:hypothetical protein
MEVKMKRLNKIPALIAFAAGLFLLAGNSVFAQLAQPPARLSAIDNNGGYRTAIGIRAGETSGLTFKRFVSPNMAVEGIIGFFPNAIGITGLYEGYVATDVEGLNWYYGGGAHVTAGTGATNRTYYSPRTGRYEVYRYRDYGVGLGIDGIAGIEYKIPRAPFAFSLDVKPYIEVNSGDVYLALDPGLGIKVAF